MRWQTHPSIPPVPIQKPGVMISQKIPRQIAPLYIWPTPGMKKLKTAAVPGLLILFTLLRNDNTLSEKKRS